MATHKATEGQDHGDLGRLDSYRHSKHVLKQSQMKQIYGLRPLGCQIKIFPSHLTKKHFIQEEPINIQLSLRNIVWGMLLYTNKIKCRRNK